TTPAGQPRRVETVFRFPLLSVETRSCPQERKPCPRNRWTAECRRRAEFCRAPVCHWSIAGDRLHPVRRSNNLRPISSALPRPRELPALLLSRLHLLRPSWVLSPSAPKPGKYRPPVSRVSRD